MTWCNAQDAKMNATNQTGNPKNEAQLWYRDLSHQFHNVAHRAASSPRCCLLLANALASVAPSIQEILNATSAMDEPYKDKENVDPNVQQIDELLRAFFICKLITILFIGSNKRKRMVCNKRKRMVSNKRKRKGKLQIKRMVCSLKYKWRGMKTTKEQIWSFKNGMASLVSPSRSCRLHLVVMLICSSMQVR